jgi:ribonuclease D
MKDTRSLPAPIWIDNAASFRAMLVHLRGEPILAVDTESNSLYVYQEQVCLIQISVPGSDYLVDPLALDDISGLGPLLADPKTLKVFHGAEYDLIVLHRDFGFEVSNLFDTMWASRILGWPAHGLGALLESRFGVLLNKKYQRANWGLRPLPHAQLDYARMDTHYLLPLHQIQAEELEATGRWPQARHRFRKMLVARTEPKGFDPEGFWRLSGIRDLDDVGRGVLREVYLYRNQRARAENRPPFKVLGNKVMVTISDQRPDTREKLLKINGVSSRILGRYGKGLLRAIRRGEQKPIAWEERPRFNNNSPHKANGRPSAACQSRFEALRAWRNKTADSRGVEPDIVMTNHTLWAVAHRNPCQPKDLSQNGLLAPWQVEDFGTDILAILANQR